MSEYMNPDMGHEIGWDDPIENDNSFDLVPEGDYNFRVLKFERGRHNGSAKLPPCNKAILTIEVWNETSRTVIIHNIFLHSKTEGMLCEFFTAIGQRKHGEKLVPRWNQVTGATGTCKVIVDKYQNQNGGESTNNKIRKFYDKPAQQTAYQQPPQQTYSLRGNTAYTPGAF